MIGSKACAPVTQHGHSQIVCQLPEDQGLSKSVVVTANGQVSNNKLFSYSNPSVVSVSPVTAPTSGNINVTISGASFGTVAGVVTIDGNDCPVVSQNHSTIVCTAPAGQGQDVTLRVTVDLVQSSPVFLYSYDGPEITQVTPLNGTTEGGFRITILGDNFGVGGAVVLVGGVSCPVFTLTHTNITCTLASGEGEDRFVIVTVGAQSSAAPHPKFAYNAPVIFSATPRTDFTAGGSVITITGENFGTSGFATLGSLCTLAAQTRHPEKQTNVPP
jgi:hypothetical protein